MRCHFPSDVKEELVHLSGHELHCVVAELAAVLSFSAEISCSEDSGYSIVLETENIAVAKRVYLLLKKAFRFQPKVVVSRHESGKKKSYIHHSGGGSGKCSAGVEDSRTDEQPGADG